MTTSLDQLQNELGYLSAAMINLDAARSVWRFAEDLDTYSHALINPPTQFITGFELAKNSRNSETPLFFFGMCFVRAFSVFDHYMGHILRDIILSNPRVLLSSEKKENRKIDYKDFIDRIGNPNDLLLIMANREHLRLSYLPIQTYLDTMRSNYGLSTLGSDLDTRIVHISLMRNCVVHNQGKTDERLHEASKGFYPIGARLHIDLNNVSRAISIILAFSAKVDSAAVEAHKLKH